MLQACVRVGGHLRRHVRTAAARTVRLCVAVAPESRGHVALYATLVRRTDAAAGNALLQSLGGGNTSVAASVLLTEQDPTKLGLSHAGKYYAVSDADYKKLFAAGPRCMKDMQTVFRQVALQVREPALTINEALRSLPKGRMPRFFIDGPRHSGKSMTLAHVTHFCHRMGWLVMYLPYGSDITYRTLDRQRSLTHPGLIDLGENAQVIMQAFHTANAEILNSIKAKRKYMWTDEAGDETAAGSGLDAMVARCFRGSKLLATSVFKAILEELKMIEDIPMLVAIDELNTLFDKTTFRDFDYDVVHPHQTTLMHLMGEFFNDEKSLRYGAFVFSYSRSGDVLTEKEFAKSDWELYRRRFRPYSPQQSVVMQWLIRNAAAAAEAQTPDAIARLHQRMLGDMLGVDLARANRLPGEDASRATLRDPKGFADLHWALFRDASRAPTEELRKVTSADVLAPKLFDTWTGGALSVKVPFLTRAESASAVSYAKERGLISKPVTEKLQEELFQMTSGNPRILYKTIKFA
eukprot:Opistho-2@9053